MMMMGKEDDDDHPLVMMMMGKEDDHDDDDGDDHPPGHDDYDDGEGRWLVSADPEVHSLEDGHRSDSIIIKSFPICLQLVVGLEMTNWNDPRRVSKPPCCVAYDQ